MTAELGPVASPTLEWYELTWGNVVDTRAGLEELCSQAGLAVIDETGFSRFHIVVAEKPV